MFGPETGDYKLDFISKAGGSSEVTVTVGGEEFATITVKVPLAPIDPVDPVGPGVKPKPGTKPGAGGKLSSTGGSLPLFATGAGVLLLGAGVWFALGSRGRHRES